jgi:hypothetical protein
MIIATIYTCNGDTHDDQFSAMLLLIRHEGLRTQSFVSVKEVMTLTHGKMNPNNGFVFVMNDETVVTDIYGLCEWINSKGLRRC